MVYIHSEENLDNSSRKMTLRLIMALNSVSREPFSLKKRWTVKCEDTPLTLFFLCSFCCCILEVANYKQKMHLFFSRLSLTSSALLSLHAPLPTFPSTSSFCNQIMVPLNVFLQANVSAEV